MSDSRAESELSSLMVSVNRVGKVVERAYGADGLTIACQACTSGLSFRERAE